MDRESKSYKMYSFTAQYEQEIVGEEALNHLAYDSCQHLEHVSELQDHT